jgi:hypothetical protein
MRLKLRELMTSVAFLFDQIAEYDVEKQPRITIYCHRSKKKQSIPNAFRRDVSSGIAMKHEWHLKNVDNGLG